MRVGDTVRHRREKTVTERIIATKKGHIHVTNYGWHDPRDWELMREKNTEEILEEVLLHLDKLSSILDRALAKKEEEQRAQKSADIVQKAKMAMQAQNLKAQLESLDGLSPKEIEKALESRQEEAKLMKMLKTGAMSVSQYLEQALKKQMDQKGNGAMAKTPEGDLNGMITPSKKAQGASLKSYEPIKPPSNQVGVGFSSGTGSQMEEKFIHTKEGFILNG